jgi:hypothetical protein
LYILAHPARCGVHGKDPLTANGTHRHGQKVPKRSLSLIRQLIFDPPAQAEIAGSTAERLPEVHTNATTDFDLLAVWLKSHAGGSPHTLRAYKRIGSRFLEALAAAGTNLRSAKVDDVQGALEAMRTRADGSARSAEPSTLTSPL